MKPLLFIIGLLMAGVGIVFITGTIMGRFEGTSSYTLITDMVGMTMLGLMPLSIGIFFIYKALQK
jgi:hypothetical protein